MDIESSSEDAVDRVEGSAPAGERIGMVVGLRPEAEARYLALHADPWRGVLDRLTASHITDYSIHLARLGGRIYLFSRFTYTGDDFEGDLRAMGEDEETQRWWAETDPCQIVLEGTPDGEQWLTLPEVFYHA